MLCIPLVSIVDYAESLPTCCNHRKTGGMRLDSTLQDSNSQADVVFLAIFTMTVQDTLIACQQNAYENICLHAFFPPDISN